MYLKKNINGIIGTIIFHLLILVAFLSFKLGKVKEKHEDQIAIELSNEDYKTIEQIIAENKPKDININPLPQNVVKNIAVNTANEMKEKIDAHEIEKQIMKEEGIKSLKPKEIDNGEPVVTSEKDLHKKPKETKKEYTGRTITEFFLKNRTGRYIHKPNYLCQYGGTVKMKIVVNHEGDVVNVSVLDTNTSDNCIIEMAIESAKLCRFNTDYNAPSRQEGTLTYTFISQ